MPGVTNNKNTFLSLTEDQASELRYSFMNIEAEANFLDEEADGIHLPSTMNLLNSCISKIEYDIIGKLDDKTISTDEVKYLLKNIGTLSNLMRFLSNVHDGIRLLKNHVDDARDLLNQGDKKGGASCQ